MDEDERWIEDEDKEEECGEDEHDESFGFDLFSSDKKDPTDEFKVNIGELTLNLHGIQARYPHLLQSTGMTLWQGSQRLCKHLCENPDTILDKNVVELGAGLGLCGLVAHKHGARRVVMTDGDSDTLKNMRSNIALNVESEVIESKSVVSKQLLWGKNVKAFQLKWAAEGGFDICMGGDIAYAQESLQILFETALGLLSSKDCARFLLSFVFRGGVTTQSIEECAREHSLIWTRTGEGSKEALYIFQRSSYIEF
eukprot:scaffold630_cov234-Chaetoceros_neogracile.AAC.1